MNINSNMNLGIKIYLPPLMGDGSGGGSSGGGGEIKTMM